MQRTEKYFEKDAFRKSAAGVILAAEADATTGGGRIALDGTVFYPEGGGQPADRGTLTLADGTVLHVTDVHETGGVIWHTVDALPEAAQPGTAVTGAIDWAWRFDKMQQHTGEHILSGILHQMFGAENVGFHIGSDAVRMDTSVPISAEGLREAETAANRVIWEDVPVVITYPTPEELAALTYRSKKEIAGQVRIVTIPGADVCACCGTHTATTGQVGQIKILASENYKGGVRLSVVCGGRALREAQAMRSRQADIGALLSAKADQTAVAVHRVYDEYTALKFAHFGLCQQLFDAMAAQLGPDETAIRIVPGLDPDGLHRLAARLIFALGYSGSHGHHDMSARRAGGLLLGRAVCVRTGLAPSAAHHRHLRADVRASGRPADAGGGADPAYRGRPNRTLAAECGACGRRHHHV